MNSEGESMPRPIQYGNRPRENDERQPRHKEGTQIQTPGVEKYAMLRRMVEEGMRYPDFDHIDIKTLWDTSHFRINIYRYYPEAGKKSLDESYFVSIYADGVVFSPPLPQQKRAG